MTLFVLIVSIVIASLASMIGGIALIAAKRRSKRVLQLMVPFGAGALLAAAFFDLLPEAVEHAAHADEVFVWVLGGFLAFFLFERLVGWFHTHHPEHDTKGSQRSLIVFGDLVHNVIDGLAIGAAFLVSIPTGIITTLAVAAHEVPKELGTFSLLLERGWRGPKVIGINLLTAVGTLVAAIALYSSGVADESTHIALLAATAGFFIYIAASDIIPDIHEQPRKLGTVQAGMLFLGVILVGALVSVLHG